MPPELASGNTGSWIICLPAPLLVRLTPGYNSLILWNVLVSEHRRSCGLGEGLGAEREKTHNVCFSWDAVSVGCVPVPMEYTLQMQLKSVSGNGL